MPHPIAWTYPPLDRQDVVDDYHGTPIADPYRRLEEPDHPATRAWIDAQTALARSYLDAVPERAALRDALSALWRYTRLTAPEKHGERYFYWQTEGIRADGTPQNQPELWRRDGLDGTPQLVLDPNGLSDDGTVAVTGTAFTRDGRTLAVVLTRGGSDWQEIHIRDVDSGRDYDEVLGRVRFPAIAWHPDGSGFYYNGHGDDGSVDGLSAESNTGNKLFWHTLGTPQSADRLVYERPDDVTLNFPPRFSDDDAYVVLHVWHAAINKNRIVVHRPADGTFQRLFDDAAFSYDFLGNDGSWFYFLTDDGAERGRVIAVDVDHPARDGWRELVAEQPETLDFARLVADHLVLGYLRDAHHTVRIADRDGAWRGAVDLPSPVAVLDVSGKRRDADLFVSYHSFLQPPTVVRHAVAAGTTTLFHAPTLPVDTSDLVTRLVFVDSADNARIPLFITHRRDIALDGSRPTLLYGYGGFSVAVPPAFKPDRLLWLLRGGVFAQAVLRGGSEYGDDWHRAGMLGNKQNVFDDFIACGRYLVGHGYTGHDRLAIEGRSNGGLLVAACLTQRPELFGAVLCHVPVIDMLRYHRFTAGRYWVAEYGDPDNPDHFPFLLAYSPLHNVRPGTRYPPTLIFTADKDDRVVPMHAHKFAATLQHDAAPDNPVLLRFELQAGHGFGKPVAKLIDEAADQLAFLSAVLSGA